MSSWLTRQRAFHYWLSLIPICLLLWYFPYIDFPIRVTTWVLAFLILAGSIYFAWKFAILRWLFLAAYALVALFLFTPSQRPPDPSALRSDYCTALQSYEGCHYVWGGEGYLGVDCSGLVQRGLENALVTRGLLTLNPNPVREALWLYWHRTTAKVLGEGNHAKTYTVTTCSTLNSLDYSLVQPGDLAVTVSGDHVMAYLGNQTWIAADPIAHKVTKFTIPDQKNGYFSTPMKIVRWKVLATDSGS